MFTVYFDTCFYLRLGAVEEADEVIGRVVALPARPVVSLRLIEELTANEGPNDAMMIKRMMALPPPLQLNCEFGWEVLSDRPEPASAARNARADRLIEATRALARRGPTREQAEKIASSVGLSVASNEHEVIDHVELVTAGRMDLKQAVHVLGADPGDLGVGDGPFDMRTVLVKADIDWGALAAVVGLDSPPTTPGEVPAWTARALANLRRLFPEHMTHMDLRDPLIDAEVANSTSLHDVALGVASRSATSRFSSTFGDNDHIATFLRHRDVVDFIQMDSARYEKMKADAKHPLRSRGIDHVCFAGKDLAEMVDGLVALAGRDH